MIRKLYLLKYNTNTHSRSSPPGQLHLAAARSHATQVCLSLSPSLLPSFPSSPSFPPSLPPFLHPPPKSMAKLGHHPGDLFLSAFLPTVQNHLEPPATRRGGALPLSLSRPEPGSNLPQNLSLLLVALAVLQYHPSTIFWEALTHALLSLTSIPPPAPAAAAAAAAAATAGQAERHNPPSLPLSLQLIDVSSCLWALAALDFPPSLPPSLLPALLERLEELLASGQEVELEAAKQVREGGREGDREGG